VALRSARGGAGRAGGDRARGDRAGGGAVRPRVEHRQQADVRRREQPQRVDVGDPVAPRSPVQAGGRASRVSGGERAEDRSPGDRRPGHDGRGDGFVGRPQPVVVLQGHDAAARQQAGEHDHPRGGGQDRSARGCGEVDPAMTRAEAVRRLLERPHDGRGGRPERPPVRRPRCGCPDIVRLAACRAGRAAPRRRPGRRRQCRAHQADEHRCRRPHSGQGCSRPSPPVAPTAGASRPAHARHPGPATAAAAVRSTGCGWRIARVDKCRSGPDATEDAGRAGRMLGFAPRRSR
jgi:hypothetical protein